MARTLTAAFNSPQTRLHFWRLKITEPHYESVLLGLGVIVPTHSGHHKTELSVQVLSGQVAHADLERHGRALSLCALASQLAQEASTQALAPGRDGDGNVGHVSLVRREHEAAVARHFSSTLSTM